MGFKAKKKLYRLTFAEDTDMAGLDVVASSVPLGTLLRLQEMADRGEEIAKDKAAFREVVEILAGAMLSWNLEDDFDQPVPVTVEGILAQDVDFVIAVIRAWTKAISGVADPLGAGSTSGAQFPEASIPMEPVSKNPLS